MAGKMAKKSLDRRLPLRYYNQEDKEVVFSLAAGPAIPNPLRPPVPHPPYLTPLLAILTRFRSLTPLLAPLTKIGGRGCHPGHRAPSKHQRAFASPPQCHFCSGTGKLSPTISATSLFPVRNSVAAPRSITTQLTPAIATLPTTHDCILWTLLQAAENRQLTQISDAVFRPTSCTNGQLSPRAFFPQAALTRGGHLARICSRHASRFILSCNAASMAIAASGEQRRPSGKATSGGRAGAAPGAVVNESSHEN